MRSWRTLRIGGRRASARFSARIDFNHPRRRASSTTLSTRSSPRSTSFVHRSSSFSFSRWLPGGESALTHTHTHPPSGRCEPHERAGTKNGVRNGACAGNAGDTQRKVTRFTGNARKPREHATRERKREREKERTGYTRGECLTIDFHASLIYSTAPPAAAFFVPAGPNDDGAQPATANQPAYTPPPTPSTIRALPPSSPTEPPPPRFMDFHDDSF